ncbi:MAG: hypothetical protein CMH36_10035 [Microbacterium sp.]|uniref:Uncharacterized protein n=1 Tax=Microbacterium ginsengisoli TaxID=400772 RepID=A0A3C1KGK8_9MICO|nr:hypothetical protein [Microbacterium sp. 4NA327F11]MAL07148.1 hypothetical protein [Microbacterium sp.]MCK9917243.1 hypothetical protein [Microbacteriaceae bacterium K1510]HAN25817.1 hypothetical protein [Microbacterium ginsengisoli]
MSEHTPSLDELREEYMLANTRHHDSYQTGVSVEAIREAAGADFDRAIAAHETALLREVADELFSGGEPDDVDDMPDQQFYDMRTAQWLRAKANERSGR